MGSSTSFRLAWTTRSAMVGTDDSYCPSCNRVSECSGVDADLCGQAVR
jgi:hypothetical protein